MAACSLPWVSPELVQAILQEQDEDCAAVESVQLVRALAANENYLSDLFRMHVTLKAAGSLRLMLKAPPASAGPRATVDRCGFFVCELRAQQDTLPALQRELARAHRLQPLGPRLIGCFPNGAMLMEDLREEGYLNVPREEGLDLEHSLIGVHAIARWHAASVSLHARSARYARVFEEEYGSFLNPIKESTYRDLAIGSMRTLARVVRGWESMPNSEEIASRLEVSAEGAIMKLKNAIGNKEGEFCVLNHGDLWSNNIMFNYNEETAQVNSTRLVDFQTINWGSPALDLLYFLELAVSRRVRREHTGRVLRAYHAELLACLDALGVDADPSLRPSLAALQRALRQREYWAYFLCVTLMPNRFAEPGSALDVEAMLQEGNPGRVHAYSRPLYRQVVEEMLPLYVERGFL